MVDSDKLFDYAEKHHWKVEQRYPGDMWDSTERGYLVTADWCYNSFWQHYTSVSVFLPEAEKNFEKFLKVQFTNIKSEIVDNIKRSFGLEDD